MIPTGKRTKVVTLENPGAAVADGAGGFTETWAALDPPTAWAALDALASADMERLTADTLVASGTHAVTLPYHPGVTVQTRLTYTDPDRGARVFQVLGLRDPEEARRELVLVVAEALP
jgi:head-tail adaptor